ncbi:MAG: Acetylornithine deacetylase [uncultured Solirubrobacteraceae bacterium]|uniref:Acetylornithine deacetylase n=1 Tax=uncultured Solirubrobacteraceae bacterium TaxID=1162706 RepID=A0A6J4TG60_9ACTN|nr:MAG: Acetylornithine deacetylase [uncultured Solirubrobacteraceae bacterium]
MGDDLTSLLADLVAIDSVNPSLVPGGAGEAGIAAFVAEWSREAGLEVEVLEETPGRPSVLARARGTGGGGTLLLCAHLDTVNVEGMADPHVPRVDGDRLYGRGAYDMKAGLAGALIAAREAARAGLAGDVVVAAVADEEHASLGVQEALRAVEADAAIVTEPTELELAVAHKGFVWSEVRVEGRSAHGSRPHLGRDAIVKMGAVLTGLGALDEALAAQEHPLLGRGSVHASVIEGGVEMSSYPARCVVGLERRTLPGETGEDVERELAALLDRCRAADPAFAAEQRTLLVREPFEVARDAQLVAVVREAAAGVMRQPPRVGGVSYWADSAYIAAAGIPTVLFGPGGEGAHAVEEWVSLSDTEVVARTLAAVARTVCA